MKKIALFAVLATLAAGCASTNGTTTTASNQPLTLEEALQKSAETRQKLQEAQQAYQNAKNAAATANANNSGDTVVDTVKTQIQEKINTSKTQVDNEVQAWKEVLKN